MHTRGILLAVVAATLTGVFREELMKSPTADIHCTRMMREMDGFYLFGGVNARGEALNDCWVLRFTEEGCVWALVDQSGAPLARYDHTSVYLKNMLIVYGKIGKRL